MPSLIRFVVVVLVLGGLTLAGMIYLAYFVEPNSREMTDRVPTDLIQPQP